MNTEVLVDASSIASENAVYTYLTGKLYSQFLASLPVRNI